MNESIQQLRERLERLEHQVGILQDQEEIANVIARYGPAVDSGSPENTSALWSRDGTYSYPLGGEVVTLTGRENVFSMVLGDTHQSIIRSGAAHLLTAPVISLNGDHATAVCYSVLLRNSPEREGFEVWRLSSNRWELARSPEGWLVAARENHLLDGSEAARELLRLPPKKTGFGS